MESETNLIVIKSVQQSKLDFQFQLTMTLFVEEHLHVNEFGNVI